MHVYESVSMSKGTDAHAFRTAKLAKDFGRFLGLTKQNIDSLVIGAMFHDNGKKYLPKRVLYKRGKLTETEFEIIKSHVVLNEVDCEDEDALDIMMQHHERVDGKGYPFGLKGDQINYLAKVFTLVDVYDALVSDRVYRKALPVHTALGIMADMTGSHFDELLFFKFKKFIGQGHK